MIKWLVSRLIAHIEHSVNKLSRVNLRVRLYSSEVNEAGVPASNTRLIGHYKALETSEGAKLKEEI